MKRYSKIRVSEIRGRGNQAVDIMWVESSMQIGDQDVQLCIERLEDDVRDRTAAVLAWLTLETVRADDGVGAAAWHECAAELLRQHVSFVVPSAAEPNDLGPAWWNEAVGRAFCQFVRHNEMAPAINRHLEMLTGLGALSARSHNQSWRG
jgi:hypothetical protein